jgi:hypothetical protein
MGLSEDHHTMNSSLEFRRKRQLAEVDMWEQRCLLETRASRCLDEHNRRCDISHNIKDGRLPAHEVDVLILLANIGKVTKSRMAKLEDIERRFGLVPSPLTDEEKQAARTRAWEISGWHRGTDW